MLKTLYMNQPVAEAFKNRLRNLTPDARRRFGTMSLPEMLAHLEQTLKVSLGEVPAKDESNWLVRNIVGPLAFHVLPWPRGRLKTADLMLVPPEGEVEELIQRICDAIDRFVEVYEKEPERTAISPLLGPLTLRQWALVHGRHIPHHLEQFGA